MRHRKTEGRIWRLCIRYKEQERIEKALELIDACVIDGLVYATYEDGLILKDLIWAYNARH